MYTKWIACRIFLELKNEFYCFSAHFKKQMSDLKKYKN